MAVKTFWSGQIYSFIHSLSSTRRSLGMGVSGLPLKPQQPTSNHQTLLQPSLESDASMFQPLHIQQQLHAMTRETLIYRCPSSPCGPPGNTFHSSGAKLSTLWHPCLPHTPYHTSTTLHLLTMQLRVAYGQLWKV